MNIQEAVNESLKTKNMISRKAYKDTYLIPTNNPYSLVVIYIKEKGRLPSRGWQPNANDLIADDWYITNESYQNLIIEM